MLWHAWGQSSDQQNDVVAIMSEMILERGLVLITAQFAVCQRPACLVEVDGQMDQVQEGLGQETPASSNCLGSFLAGKCEQGQSGASTPRRIGSHNP